MAMVRSEGSHPGHSKVLVEFAKPRLARLTKRSSDTYGNEDGIDDRILQQEEPPSTIGLALRMAEAGVLPDLVLRSGTRHLLRRRLRESVSGSLEARRREQSALMDRLASGPIAIAVRQPTSSITRFRRPSSSSCSAPGSSTAAAIGTAARATSPRRKKPCSSSPPRRAEIRRRHADPRPRLWLGLVLALGSGAVPECANPRCVEFADSA